MQLLKMLMYSCDFMSLYYIVFLFKISKIIYVNCIISVFFSKRYFCPGQCGSVGQSIIPQTEVTQSDSQSGHKPRLGNWSLDRAPMRQ